MRLYQVLPLKFGDRGDDGGHVGAEVVPEGRPVAVEPGQVGKYITDTGSSGTMAIGSNDSYRSVLRISSDRRSSRQNRSSSLSPSTPFSTSSMPDPFGRVSCTL